ncbi:probable cyclic nucleotide-gated ion channel 20, chloroplastic isoform X2 [Zingiber officinale]|uniref:probable cyclic nucleotide-gated ion channel 20, chloroplastic isoform X2 n=1 Tax=Zingiber officinale TaxID=94328 RepID=UPI001C4DAF6D|nr:probable cyclic nucleotide-gated ion channel 20, chloroplastic isoform X2 [Zingiber officinale]
MTDLEDDHSSTLSGNIELPRFTARSASMSMSPSFAIDERTSEIGPVSGPLSRSNAVTLDDSFYGGDVMSNKSLQMAGPPGLCNDPDQTESPAAYKTQKGNIELPRFTARSVSMSIPPSFAIEDTFISHTGPLRIRKVPEISTVGGPLSRNTRHGVTRVQSRSNAGTPEVFDIDDSSYGGDVMRHEHLLMSGPLGPCNNPDRTECPAAYKTKKAFLRSSISLDKKLHDILYGDNHSWAEKWVSRLNSYFPIMNPHTRVVQQWNQFFVISCLVAIFIDPLFFFLLSVKEEEKCIVFNWSLAIGIAVVRSVTDFIYLLHMILQFRLAYVAPESRVVDTGDLVDQPKKIALNYLRGYFFLDLFVVLPLPQVMILAMIPDYVGPSAAIFAKNLLRVTVLLQYIPRIIRFVPLLGEQSATGFIFESAWASFVNNLPIFVLVGHVVGSCWYLFGLQRVNQCLQDACTSQFLNCKTLIDCGRGDVDEGQRQMWVNDSNSNSCFDIVDGTFRYGIYQQVVLLSTQPNVVQRYIYALFWGFQQISTLAGNQVPSIFLWEVLFTMAIIGTGLFLFPLLIGNMQNVLQSLGRRKVRQAERFTWAATRGINEEQLLENLPEDIQREIHRHFFGFLNKVRIFSLMDEPMLDAIYKKLKQKVYIKGSDIFYKGGPVEKMVFIVSGKLESIGADGNIAPLAEGDVCGEELLTWYLEHTSVTREGGRIQFPGSRSLSTRTVTCLTNVEAFALHAADLEEVTTLFSQFLRNPRGQGAIKDELPYWRKMPVTRCQVAWRYRQKRLKCASITNNLSANHTARR